MTTRRCIYCLDDKPHGAFNREHVIPQAFGRFDDNLVVDCVCKDCNDYFGRTIDLKLGRDSCEGFHRFVVGEKAAKEYKSFGRSTTSTIEIKQDGPMKNMLCKPVPSPDGTTLGYEPLDQIGFSLSEDGPYVYFPLEALPTRNDLAANGFPVGAALYMNICAADLGKAEAALIARGFRKERTLSETLPPVQRVNAEFAFQIAEPECRAASKIALNYLAHEGGASVALMAQFNDVRAYARTGTRSRVVVETRQGRKIGSRATGQPALCHYVSVQRLGERVVAHVSLYCMVRYVVTLSFGPFLTAFNFSSAHLFDVRTRKVSKVPVEVLG